MRKFLKMVKMIVRSNTQHFLSIDSTTYFKWRWLIQILIRLNRNYIACELLRIEYKHMKNIVIIGLRWSGKNVKRRTNGYAKEWIFKHKKYVCPYCECKLTKTNATSDHIVPISLGGNNCQVNIIVCCTDCNGERGDKEFYSYLRRKNPKYKAIKRPFL